MLESMHATLQRSHIQRPSMTPEEIDNITVTKTKRAWLYNTNDGNLPKTESVVKRVNRKTRRTLKKIKETGSAPI